MNEFERTENGQTAEERAFIDRFTAEYCRPHVAVVAQRLASFVEARRFALVGAASGFVMAAGESDSAAAVKAPEEEVAFTFASAGDPEASDAWRASLVVPPGATADTVLSLKVFEANGGACAGGTFRLAGITLPLSGDGTALIPFGVFLAGIKDSDVALVRPGAKPVDGTLAFFA